MCTKFLPAQNDLLLEGHERKRMEVLLWKWGDHQYFSNTEIMYQHQGSSAIQMLDVQDYLVYVLYMLFCTILLSTAWSSFSPDLWQNTLHILSHWIIP